MLILSYIVGQGCYRMKLQGGECHDRKRKNLGYQTVGKAGTQYMNKQKRGVCAKITYKQEVHPWKENWVCMFAFAATEP